MPKLESSHGEEEYKQEKKTLLSFIQLDVLMPFLMEILNFQIFNMSHFIGFTSFPYICVSKMIPVILSHIPQLEEIN